MVSFQYRKLAPVLPSALGVQWTWTTETVNPSRINTPWTFNLVPATKRSHSLSSTEGNITPKKHDLKKGTLGRIEGRPIIGFDFKGSKWCYWSRMTALTMTDWASQWGRRTYGCLNEPSRSNRMDFPILSLTMNELGGVYLILKNMWCNNTSMTMRRISSEHLH